MRISYSAFDNYAGCPARYKFRYIDHISTEKKPEMEFGSLMHDIVCFALKKDPIIPAIEELNELFDQKLPEINFPDELKAKQYAAVGKEMIKKFHESLKPGLRTTIATEKNFNIPLNEKHTLNGVIDRVDKLPYGAFEVVDYKTSFKPKTQSETDKDKQLGIYKLAVENLWPDASDVRLTFHFLRPDIKLTTTRQKSDIETLKNEIIDIADKIESDTEWQPKKNNLCDWCDFQHLCPLMKQKVARQEDAPPQEIDNIVEQYLEANNIIKELEPKIQKHFDQEKIEAFHHKKGVISRSKKGKFTIRKK